MRNRRTLAARASIALIISMLALPLSIIAQTKITQITPPKNPYPLAKDVQLGQQPANEVQNQLPLVNDSGVQAYLERVGRRLVAAIPNEFQHQEFRYSFRVVDVSDLNAFALPGGFTFVNRG